MLSAILKIEYVARAMCEILEEGSRGRQACLLCGPVEEVLWAFLEGRLEDMGVPDARFRPVASQGTIRKGVSMTGFVFCRATPGQARPGRVLLRRPAAYRRGLGPEKYLRQSGS